MERNEGEIDPDSETSTIEIIKEFIFRPFVRGLSFGMAHYLTFVVICPLVFRKLNKHN